MAPSATGRLATQSIEKSEHDSVEYRKRVATHVDGNTVAYEDTTFTSGDSPAVLNISADIGRVGHEGYIINDGPGDLKVEVSHDGTNYGGQHTLKDGDQLVLEDLKINRIRLTYVDNTSYRALIA